jgi:hypothetical protein
VDNALDLVDNCGVAEDHSLTPVNHSAQVAGPMIGLERGVESPVDNPVCNLSESWSERVGPGQYTAIGR